MQTLFTDEQLQDPGIAEADGILRKCVHCGFCTATCPTYVLLGDELDSPRGRIYLIKDMLEKGRPADAGLVKHIDRCLSCLACVTTCPASVDYMHLVDHARAHIEKTYRRPLFDRFIRAFLARVLPDPKLFGWVTKAGSLARPLRFIFAPIPGLKRIAAMLEIAPKRLPAAAAALPALSPAEGKAKARVALLSGCVHPVLRPDLNEATIRLLNRHGADVVVPDGEGCCGAVVHHMGREDEALALARRNVDAWIREIEGQGLDAIIVNVSGCGTTVKDYGHMLRLDPAYAEKAAKVSALARDITEFIGEIGLLAPVRHSELTVAYHSACSMQHGQKITTLPKRLLVEAGFRVRDVPEGHLCCGSAGTYNMLQPEIARRLRDRKVRNIEAVTPDLIATGNIGCMTQLGPATAIPIVHTLELLDWATGGPRPAALGLTG
ncbi:MAG: glycolate oxidase subunit GlcF [Hyphomicrobiales bacterium]|nr:glycolate oxidase subunit GlcF [Hyphomicrobiales bacterium]